jgi:hypothetical protein
MQVGTYADGRPLNCDEGVGTFDVGGTPITAQQMIEYDQAGQISWASEALRGWAYQCAQPAVGRPPSPEQPLGGPLPAPLATPQPAQTEMPLPAPLATPQPARTASQPRGEAEAQRRGRTTRRVVVVAAVAVILVLVAVAVAFAWASHANGATAGGTWGTFAAALENGNDAAAFGTLSEGLRAHTFGGVASKVADPLREALGRTSTFEQDSATADDVWMASPEGSRVEIQRVGGRWQVTNFAYVRQEAKPEPYDATDVEYTTTFLPAGTRITIKAPVAGSELTTYSVVYTNNEESSRSVVGTETVEEAEAGEYWVGTGSANSTGRRISSFRTGTKRSGYVVTDNSSTLSLSKKLQTTFTVSGSGGKTFDIVVLQPSGEAWTGTSTRISNGRWYWWVPPPWQEGANVVVITIDGHAAKWKTITFQ